MDSKFVFHLDLFDASEGLSDAAALAGDHGPMALETAIWAPEVTGGLGFPAFTVLDLRGAIQRGELRPERHGHRILVTRTQLKEWRDRCRVQSNPLASTSTQSGKNSSSATGTQSPASRSSSDSRSALEMIERLKRR